VDGASLGKHPPPPAVSLHAVPSRAEVSRAKAGWSLRSSKELLTALLATPVNMTSHNSKTTVTRQEVNTTLLNSGAYYVFVLCVIRPEAK
jgi:hypothetical protein